MRHRSPDNEQAIRKAETPKTCNYRTRGCRAWNKEINYRDSSESATAEESADIRGGKKQLITEMLVNVQMKRMLMKI